MKFERSQRLFKRAQHVMVGGVNSPARSFGSVGGNPLVFHHAKGSRIFDVDGNGYLDYIGSWGPLILGHGDEEVSSQLKNAIERGTSFGATSEMEILFVEEVVKFFPSIETLRLVSSGTEATMSAIRLARGFTGRDKIVKFEGGYHGHADSFLIKAGSGATTLGVPDSKGVTKATAADTLSARYNDLESVERLVKQHPREIAAVIIEPIAGNMGVVTSKREFLEGLRQLCDSEGIVLVFDEVMSGFRVARGGAQELYNVSPDLTTLGKIIGGGLPVGAFGGRAEIMETLSPKGPVYQAGTLSGNPLAVTCGYYTLKKLWQENFYSDLETKAQRLHRGLLRVAEEAKVPVRLNRAGSMMTLFFTEQDVTDYRSAKCSDTSRFAGFFWNMLERNVLLPPSQFEAFFVSVAHSDEDIDATIEAAKGSISSLST